MKIFKTLLIVTIPVLLLVGCGTKGGSRSGGVTDMGDGGTAVQRDGGSGAETIAVPGDSGFSGAQLDDPASLLSKRVIYFDFDKAEIKDEYRQIVDAHAAYLASHAGASVVLEGHADERGSREYNIGLGERRANAVRRYMSLQGAAGGQMEVISFGEERPVAFGHDEDSWSLNRRVEIIYQSK